MRASKERLKGRRSRYRAATAVLSTALGAVLLAGNPAAAATHPHAVDCSVARCVALTFDDGPGSQTTTLLRMLKDAGARATFFVLGEVVAQRPQALRQFAAAGHEIGDHTWSHPQLPLLTDTAVLSQVTRTADEIESLTGTRPQFVRPPYGALNPRVREVLGQGDWPMILWSVDPQDWKDRNSDTVYHRVIAGTRPGSIVLMHDIHPTTVAAVPRILAELKRRGYTFVTVSELYGKRLTPGISYSGRSTPSRPAGSGTPAGGPASRLKLKLAPTAPDLRRPLPPVPPRTAS
jgi:peptidoglycan/xylan/chitin deacetylase (PgdA/CDA1 family)